MLSKEMQEAWEACPPMPPRMAPEALPMAREATNAYSIERLPKVDGVELEPVTVGTVDAIWYTPSSIDSDSVVLYIHGGGFMWSSAESHQGLISRLARESKSKFLALDYKLAPEHPFPGPVNEGVELYNWLLEQGFASTKIAIAGDSAGGGLALSVVGQIKAAGKPLPVCLIASSPYADLTNSGESIDRVTMDPCVSREGLEICREAYLQGHDPEDPIASPALADFTDYPPMLIQCGSREQLLSDTLLIAARADQAGVDVTTEIYDRCIHLWNWWAPESPEAIASYKSSAAFLKRHWSE